MKLVPTVLTGRLVRLEPVGPEHADGLWEAAREPSIWTYMPVMIDTRKALEALIQEAVRRFADGEGLGFAIRDLESGQLAGSTSYLNAEPIHRRLEIGFSWLAPRWQRTGVNTECKYLLLGHAFETLGAVRVEFKTDARNERSRAALARIGAREEGTLRRHMLLPDGSSRDSVYFSVIAEEWPDVKSALERLIERGERSG